MAAGEKPPLDIEQALDLVLSLPALTAKEEGHRKFGEALQDLYFNKLRAECNTNPVAWGYLNNLLPAIAAAVRGFHVQRVSTEVRWEAIEDVKMTRMEMAKRVAQYSPLSEKGYLGKILAGRGGVGAGGVVTTWAGGTTPMLWFGCLLSAFIAICLVDFALQKTMTRRLAALQREAPEERDNVWRQRALRQYRIILKNFLLNAIKIREEWYPDLPTVNGKKLYIGQSIQHLEWGQIEGGVLTDRQLDDYLEAIIARHMAFEPTKEPQAQPGNEPEVEPPNKTEQVASGGA